MGLYKYDKPAEIKKLLSEEVDPKTLENDLCLSQEMSTELKDAPHSILLNKKHENQAFPPVDALNLDINELNRRFEEQHAFLLSLSSIVHGLIRRNGIDEDQVEHFIHHQCQTKSYNEMCKLALSHARVIINSALMR